MIIRSNYRTTETARAEERATTDPCPPRLGTAADLTGQTHRGGAATPPAIGSRPANSPTCTGPCPRRRHPACMGIDAYVLSDASRRHA